MFIVYTGNNEIIVTTPERESDMLQEYFGPNGGRDTEEYDREEENGENAVTFTSRIERE